MRTRWGWILPIIGLILFSAETVHSFRVHRQLHRDKVFYWADLPLDSDPLNKAVTEPNRARQRELRAVWIDPAFLTRMLMLSAFPAFLAGMLIVKAFAHLGVSEALSFASVMPVLVVSWFYFVGRCIDRWICKPSPRIAASIKPNS